MTETAIQWLETFDTLQNSFADLERCRKAKCPKSKRP